MKIQSLKYLTREGFRNVWVNRLMSVASVGVLVACMVLIGMALLITKNVDKSMQSLEQQNVVMVYFNDKNSVIYSDKAVSGQDENLSQTGEIPDSAYLIHNEEEAKAVCENLKKIPNIASVEFISSEKALEIAKETVLEDQAGAFEIFNEEGGNPMSHGARITLVSMEGFADTVSAIEKTSGVDSVVSHGELAKKISGIKSAIGLICFWIIGILAIISLVIVSNTIRVTMYNRKLEISIMKAVGATDSFVRLPFVIEGMVLGIISAIISEGLIYFCYRIAGEAMRSTFNTMIPFGEEAWLLLGIFLVIGILAGAVGSAFMIGKYLRKEGSEFKAL
jgi:cell division transport system permease protein